jgi:serine/threonine protein kinase
MDAIFAAYKQVLGIADDSVVQSIIENLNQNKATSTFFTDIALTLNTFAIERDRDVRIGRAGRLGHNVILPEPISKGAVGEIYMNQDRTVIYKKIVIGGVQQNKEWMIRQTFLEAFIQTVLGLDPDFGYNVCHVTNLYRSRDLVRKGRGADATADIVLYIQMEPIAYTLGNIIDKVAESGVLTMSDLSPYLSQLGIVLDGFKKRYGFAHRDLHTGNVMYRKDGTLALIDFGFSCLTVGGVVYSVQTQNILRANAPRLVPGIVDAPCESYDILIFLAAFAEGYGLGFEGDEQLKFVNLFDTRDKTFNLIDWLFNEYGKDENKGGALFHMTYPRSIATWPADIRAKLAQIPTLQPANFAAVTAGFARSMRARGGRNLYISPEKIGGLYRMAKKNSRKSNRKNRNTRRNMRKNLSGGNYQTSQQWFDPDVLPPATVLPAPSTAPTSYETRPVLLSTFQAAGGRKTRRRGGFSPSIMGGFVSNAQAAIVPLALYAVYHTMVPKKGPATLGGLFKNMTRKNRRNSRK